MTRPGADLSSFCSQCPAIGLAGPDVTDSTPARWVVEQATVSQLWQTVQMGHCRQGKGQ